MVSATLLENIWKVAEIDWGVLPPKHGHRLCKPYSKTPPAPPLPRRAMGPPMRLHAVLALEASPTLWAGEGPAVRVDVTVTQEEGTVGEAQATVGAGVGLLPGVGAPVDDQQGGLGKTEAAEGTAVGLLSRVLALVHSQQAGVREAAFAEGTRVGLLCSAGAPVGSQGAPLTEAGVGLFTAVHTHMPEQVAALGEASRALVTGEGPLSGVDLLVSGEDRGVAEVTSTVLASVGGSPDCGTLLSSFPAEFWAGGLTMRARWFGGG